MKVKEIKEIMSAFAENGLTNLKIENEGFNLELKKEVKIETSSATMVPTSVTETQAFNVSQAVTPSPTVSEPEEDDSNLIYVNSPIIGTFYKAPNPDADPYVSVGDTVKLGQVLCIIEAMKIMNEIESEVQGKIVKIFVKNAEAVEYGQKLFAVKPD